MRILFLIMAVCLCACERAPDAPTGSQTRTLPYGSWPSPVSAESAIAGSRALGSVSFDNGYLYWAESRPEEGGRITLMRWKAGTQPEELLAAPWNVRTRVQEYGGRSYTVANGEIFFSNFKDQQLYRFKPGQKPVAFTSEPGLRYAACQLDRSRQRLVCVQEDHRAEGEPTNALVALPLDSQRKRSLLFQDSDFVSAPSLSPDGKALAFVSWNHPNMPWDNTSLWSAEFADNGQLQQLVNHNPDREESVVDPQWGPGHQLYAISDRDNWWKLYRVNGQDFTPLQPEFKESELGGPAWTLGGHYYRLLEDGRIVAAVRHGGTETVMLIDPANNRSTKLPVQGVTFSNLLPEGKQLFMIAGLTDRPPELVRVNLSGDQHKVIRTAGDAGVSAAWIPQYQLVSFPTAGGATTHGIYLPPTNPQVRAPEGEAPPLIVTVHGGPTAVSSPTFSRSELFWTSRGFAMLKLNYRGSTGFGRAYRRSLYGQWGEADVEDAIAAAKWAADSGLADPDQLIIRGGSAGGFTALAAHAFHDTFATGASYYGISDLEALAQDTHKFESRYMDNLIGPYPQDKETYRERSPIHHLQGFTKPLLLLQGEDDPVVPPNQSEMIFKALEAQGVPTAYLAFPGESHGFRKSENQIRALQAELSFYRQVLGIDAAEQLPPLKIIGLEK
ncbi:prolyl oligopeptidase family serine peptidase [Microbulbifer sp. SAOS-129_SWC]|uniref:prolyl oligopeptidase family serine peptidase n=1 Tax=Microbulbifer sp. SAOS-129_SWC TaxID=3145235 RepID=UPI003216A05F